MRIGVDYYPEHWDRSLWEQDAQLMKETGVKLVRLAEFAWSRLEPEEGKFQFEWLDDAIELFHQKGIEVVLGTPTCTPPNWLVEKHPDVLPVDAQLHPRYPGVRGHRCYNSPSLHRYTKIIVDKLARRYANHPAVIGWQTDNEFGLNECNCENCNEQFRAWVRAKYGDLETVNREWGTVVWSGEYSRWSQVTTPLGGSPHLNPSYQLDYYRFQIDSCVVFQQVQLEILREQCPNQFVTHNIWSYPTMLDYYKVCEPLDFASLDYYPNTNPDKADTNLYSGALTLDLTRGIKNKNFWIMETMSGPPGCWFPMWRTPQPGFIRAFSWQSISRGADTVVHFRWRSATIGAEQFWHGLIDHSNVPGRRFREFAQLCREVNKLSDQLDGTELRNDVALLHSHEQYIAFRIQPQVEGMDYFDNLKVYHRALTKLGAGVDVKNTTDSLDGYKLVVAPSLYLLDEEMAAKLHAFAEAGGTLVLTHRTGVKNMNNVCWMEPLPGPLAKTAGIQVEEYDPIGTHVHTLTMNDDKSYTCTQWCDVIKPVTAETIAAYADDFFAGKPAVTVHPVGSGKVIYIGTQPEEAFFVDLFQALMEESGIQRFKDLPDGVQISVRQKRNEQYLFVLNLSKEVKTVEIGANYKSMLTDEWLEPVVELAPYSVDIVQYTAG
ncbi:beta-galactosidase [Marinicrinis lubricantis]|uniref:Beta-galactosidase n=1 Tax=Marinicrinis lubricantis TaxID=2086470 RepID=A0ABW1IVG4_9BACL